MKYANGPEDLPTPEQMSQMSGLEFMEAIRRGDFPGAPIAQTLGFDIHEVSDGRVVFRGTPSFKVYNPIGTVHGGWFGTILDSCMACAIQTTLPKGKAYTTLEYKVSIIRPLFERSGPVLAIGDVTHSGRRTGLATGQIVGETDGKLYATGSTTCIVMDF
ncbi:PaaI family thioesterase [Rhodovulum sp. DZ06]|uniref:PaaI family thioesterase n=1 Tax=Rhodovulum sp. DZ06 TaxID=3425126 RepID=UPI003D34958F